MATVKNEYANKLRQMPTPQGGEVMVARLAITVPAMAANDIAAVGFLPAGCMPVDVMIDFDDLDTGATATVSFGLLNSTMTDISGTAWIVGQNVQSPGFARRSTNTLDRVTVDETADRPIGFKFTGAATGNGVIAATILYRAAQYKA